MTSTWPLCVDLDGTLIAEDVTQLSIRYFLAQRPYAFFLVFWWFLWGRAYLKTQLVHFSSIDPAQLTYNPQVLSYIKEAKLSGRLVILATAANYTLASKVAEYVGGFDEVIASNAHVNLRAQAKANSLCARFGAGQFEYMGNSPDDLEVWKRAGACVIVNASPKVQQQAVVLKKPVIILR